MTFYDVWELLNFAIGLLAAEFLICTRFQKRKHFWLLLIAGILPSLIVSFVWQYIPIHNSWFTSFKFMFVFALTMVMPVAAFKTGGIVEQVDEETGWLVERGNALALKDTIRLACQNETLLREKGERSRKKAEACFSQSKMLQEYRQLYEEVLQGKQPPVL